MFAFVCVVECSTFLRLFCCMFVVHFCFCMFLFYILLMHFVFPDFCTLCFCHVVAFLCFCFCILLLYFVQKTNKILFVLCFFRCCCIFYVLACCFLLLFLHVVFFCNGFSFFFWFPDSAISPPILTSCSSHTEACNAFGATNGIATLTTTSCTL